MYGVELMISSQPQRHIFLVYDRLAIYTFHTIHAGGGLTSFQLKDATINHKCSASPHYAVIHP